MPEMNTDFLAVRQLASEHLLHLRQNRVVTTTGTPANILVAGVIGGLQNGEFSSHGSLC